MNSLETGALLVGWYKGREVTLEYCSRDNSVAYTNCEIPIALITSLEQKGVLPKYSFIASNNYEKVFITSSKKDLVLSNKLGLIVKKAHEDRTQYSPAND